MEKPPDCFMCPLVNIGHSFSKAEGHPKLGVAFLLEALGKHEAEEGLPARPNGESGSLLTTMLTQDLRLERSDFIWDNVVKCRPPNNLLEKMPYEKEAIASCSQYNGRSIDRDDVKVIVAFGNVAFKYLTGIEGKKKGISDVRGYVFGYRNKLVVPSLHPAFIRNGNPQFTGLLERDIKKAISVANGSYISYSLHPDYRGPDFILQGKLEALVSKYYFWRDNPNVTIFYDIENPYSKDLDENEKGDSEEERNSKDISYKILTIQFTDGKGWAITVPWEKPFIKVILKILALSNVKVAFNNWQHDNPRIRWNGGEINGLNHDCMWAFHHWQPGFEKALQKVGSIFDVPMIWKHLAKEEDKEDEYGGWDVIALAYIWEKLPQLMRQVGVWDSYLKYKVSYRNIVLEPMERRGIPVDEQERQSLFEEVSKEIIEEDKRLQETVPIEVRNCQPAKGYKREPKEIKELKEIYARAYEGLRERGIEDERIVSFEKWVYRKYGYTLREFGGVEKRDEEGILFDDGVELSARWCKVKPFKPSGGARGQLVKYLKWCIKRDPNGEYYVPLTLKEKKETTGSDELQEIFEKTQDPVLESVIKIRSLNKLVTNDIPNWKPDQFGLVHTHFKFDPPSWQLNSSRPNVQNAGKHTANGQRFRRIIKAPPGRCIVEFDKKAFHVVMMGFEARDPLYIKWAKLDMHTVVTSYIVNEPIPLDLKDEGEAKERIAYVKKKYKTIRDTQGKPTVLGNQLGLGPTKLHWVNATYVDENGKRQIGIESVKRAKWLQSLLADMFPKVESYKKRIQEQAHLKKFLMTSYGGVRWFNDVLRWDYKNRRYKNGTEAEEAISHCVQGDSFGMIHSEILDMGVNSEILERYWYANTMHDAVKFIPEIGDLDRCIEDVLPFLLKPAIELRDSVCCPNGLVVGVDVMASAENGNWANWDKERNPLGMREIKI